MKEPLSGRATPTERTMAWLRGQGYEVEKVEQRVTRKITRDFMGFADIIAIRLSDPAGSLAVQATDGADASGGHLAERVKKVSTEPRAKLWVACGNRLWVVGWALRGPEGTRKTFAVKVVALHDNGGGPLLPEGL
jgi:hypothetical protein